MEVVHADHAMAGTSATLVGGTLANGQILPYPAPTPVPLP